MLQKCSLLTNLRAERIFILINSTHTVSETLKTYPMSLPLEKKLIEIAAFVGLKESLVYCHAALLLVLIDFCLSKIKNKKVEDVVKNTER